MKFLVVRDVLLLTLKFISIAVDIDHHTVQIPSLVYEKIVEKRTLTCFRNL